jgi:hypothetical protein
MLGNTRRKLSFFVMVLCYSRMMYLQFAVLQTMEHFLACHEHTFAAPGAPEKILGWGVNMLTGMQLEAFVPRVAWSPSRLVVLFPIVRFAQALQGCIPILMCSSVSGHRERCLSNLSGGPHQFAGLRVVYMTQFLFLNEEVYPAVKFVPSG